jgi:phenylpropionate dioxygenase-like ring-hydroxylating dioxygenase large terminal subunit
MRPQTAEHVVKRLLAHLDAGTTDYAPSMMRMDVGRYFDQDIARAERERVFTRFPLVAAHAGELRQPGDFVSRTYLGIPLLIVRQDDGSVAAFTNVCRHRGARLELEPSGSRNRFSCRYHRWCYRLDGSLQSLPFDEGFDELDRSAHGLVALPTDERHGMVWAVLNPGPPLDMRNYLGPELDDEIGAGGVGSMALYREQTFELPMNWKFAADGYFDTYHLQFLHPKTVGPFFHTNVHTYDAFGRNSRLVVARRGIEELREADTRDRNPHEYVITNYTIYPATVWATEPDHVEAWTIVPNPHDANRCQVTLRFLVPELPRTQKQQRYRDRNWDILLGAVLNEDWAVAQSIADSLPGGSVRETVYGRNEIAAQTFYRQLQADLDGAAPELDNR